MITNYKYYKNSNTGVLIMKQWFESDIMTNLPICFYNSDSKSIDTPDLTGFVEISEKKFNQESKKQHKQMVLIENKEIALSWWKTLSDGEKVWQMMIAEYEKKDPKTLSDEQIKEIWINSRKRITLNDKKTAKNA